MPALLITIRSLPSTDERCPYCHGELGSACKACAQCHTLHHPECLAELGRCTVLGCSGPRPRVPGRRRRVQESRPSRSPLQWVGAFALFATLLCVVSPLFVDLLVHPRRGRGNEAAAIGGLKAVGTLVQLTNTGTRGDEDLIDEVLGAGTKQGYVFAITSSSQFGWTANANPYIPGTTGDRYFGANMTGLIYFHTERPVLFNPDGSSDDPVLGN